MTALLAGFAAGLSLIVAIGAQNAYVLRQGLARNRVGTIVTICAASDAVLIVAGVAGIGALVQSHPVALTVIRWAGAGYLLAFAARSFHAAARPGALVAGAESGGGGSLRTVVLTTLALTWLNPHVYLDTVIMLGSLANNRGDPGRWLFAAGATLASVTWFAGLGFGARAAAGWFARPAVWRLLDLSIGVVMVVLAVALLRADGAI